MLDSLLPYAPLGTLLSGLALLLGALVAAATLFVYHLRSREDSIYRDLCALYKRFWESNELAKVRRWIDSDAEFGVVSPALNVVNASPLPRPLEAHEASNIELIDRFCAIMMEAAFLREIGRNKKRRAHLDAMFLEHWLSKFSERAELLHYAKRYWPHLYGHIRRIQRRKPKNPAP